MGVEAVVDGVRVRLQQDVVASGLDLLDGIRWDHFGPVNLTRLQRREARRRFWLGVEYQLGQLGLRAPVVLVRFQFQHLALDVLRYFERASAGGMLRVGLVPSLPDDGRAWDGDRGQVVDQEAPRLLRRDGDSEVIDLLIAGDRPEIAGTRATLRVRVELRLFVQHAIE